MEEEPVPADKGDDHKDKWTDCDRALASRSRSLDCSCLVTQQYQDPRCPLAKISLQASFGSAPSVPYARKPECTNR